MVATPVVCTDQAILDKGASPVHYIVLCFGLERPMVQLNKVRNAWGTPGFNRVAKEEIGRLDADTLLLQQGLRNSSYAVADNLSVMVNRVSEADASIFIRVGIFYSGIIAGCNCADDPSPVDAITEFCELQLEIDKATAETKICLVPEAE